MQPRAPSTVTARPVSCCACGIVIRGVFLPASSMTVAGKSLIASQASFGLPSFFAGTASFAWRSSASFRSRFIASTAPSRLSICSPAPFTCTEKVPLVDWPRESLARQWTVVVATGKVAPDAGSQTA